MICTARELNIAAPGLYMKYWYVMSPTEAKTLELNITLKIYNICLNLRLQG
jgi:hypothetical protein